jgi:predicted dinucleotide-binding enzyme
MKRVALVAAILLLAMMAFTASAQEAVEYGQTVTGEITNEARENGIGITSVKYLTGARIVRAFNTMSFRKLAENANRPGARMAIPIAGDDKDALAVAQTLVRDAGFDPVIIGGLESAKIFAQGGPLYGQDITAQEMQQRLKTLR